MSIKSVLILPSVSLWVTISGERLKDRFGVVRKPSTNYSSALYTQVEASRGLVLWKYCAKVGNRTVKV